MYSYRISSIYTIPACIYYLHILYDLKNPIIGIDNRGPIGTQNAVERITYIFPTRE